MLHGAHDGGVGAEDVVLVAGVAAGLDLGRVLVRHILDGVGLRSKQRRRIILFTHDPLVGRHLADD